jgi:hypothetical protein
MSESTRVSQREHHVMTAELIADRQTMRYTCPVCQRCLEDGPEGLTMISKGDPLAVHRSGRLRPMSPEVEQDLQATTLLH